MHLFFTFFFNNDLSCLLFFFFFCNCTLSHTRSVVSSYSHTQTHIFIILLCCNSTLLKSVLIKKYILKIHSLWTLIFWLTISPTFLNFYSALYTPYTHYLIPSNTLVWEIFLYGFFVISHFIFVFYLSIYRICFLICSWRCCFGLSHKFGHVTMLDFLLYSLIFRFPLFLKNSRTDNFIFFLFSFIYSVIPPKFVPHNRLQFLSVFSFHPFLCLFSVFFWSSFFIIHSSLLPPFLCFPSWRHPDALLLCLILESLPCSFVFLLPFLLVTKKKIFLFFTFFSAAIIFLLIYFHNSYDVW